MHTKTTDTFPILWVAMLGLMMAISPLSIDVYLPALPSMAEDFNVSSAFLANSVTAFYIGLVFGQLFYGPFSDRVGRIKPMYIGMFIYICATLVCLFTLNPYILFGARVMQAMGACVAYVVTYAAVQDTLPPKQMAKALSLMYLVLGISPIFAPLVGAVLLQFFHWRVIFVVLLLYALLIVVLTKLFFKETLREELKNTQPAKHVLHEYIALLKDSKFVVPAVGGGLLMGTIYTYVTASSEVLLVGFNLTEKVFGIIFGVNAFGYFALAQLNHILLKHYSIVTVMRAGVLIQVIPTVLLMVLSLLVPDLNLAVVVVCLFLALAGLGLSQPNAGAITLAYQKHRAGMASAMQGAIAFSTGILGSAMLNLFEVSALTKLSITSSIMVVLGMLLLWKIQPSPDF